MGSSLRLRSSLLSKPMSDTLVGHGEQKEEEVQCGCHVSPVHFALSAIRQDFLPLPAPRAGQHQNYQARSQQRSLAFTFAPGHSL